ncbi:glycosyltransferase family 39 protein [Salinirubellus salinus]|uniref:Glycosyltransferase family 39 protein n=1 Tax=Salinirubellus salinus TaxID=1364945 RepID=A0A9E7R083_9EURY|nr:glycosyltransferase family 39 protein [Salinirubellus salinus]UWM53173.1 glycosyltransferase family 39 protein [Salinirubellus salinus]
MTGSRTAAVLGLMKANATRLYVALFVLFAGVLPLVFFRMPLHFDEALFLVIGDQWANGILPFTGIADHKPPGIYFLAYLAEYVTEYPHFLMRIVTFLTVAVTGVLVYLVGRKIATRTVGMVASLLYLLATYMPHFDGYFFITEPYSNLTIALAALLLLSDRRSYDAVAGASLAVGVLFNQTVFLFGLAFIVFRALLVRDPANRTREYLVGTAERFLTIGAGFLVPIGVTAAYFWVNGLLYELFYYSFYLPATSYSPPFHLYGHIVAAVSLAPIWLLAVAVIAQEGYRVLKGTVERHGSADVLFVACWALFIGYPGATSFVGDHKLLFSFPAVGLLAAIGLQRAYAAFATPDGSLSLTSAPRRGTPGSGSISLLAVVLAGFVLLSAVSAGFNVYYANNRLAHDIDGEKAKVDEVAAYVHDGAVFTYPSPQSMLYYHNDSITPVATFATVYDEATRKEMVADVDEQQAPYLVVRNNHVAPDGHIYGDKDLYFREQKAILVAYLNENYEPFETTETWTIYRRTG